MLAHIPSPSCPCFDCKLQRLTVKQSHAEREARIRRALGWPDPKPVRQQN